MPDVVTFDPANLRIVEISAGGDNELSIQEVYSEWKAYLLADPSRLAYPQAFRYVGSDPISETEALGTTFFLVNGWRIRPAELNHKLTLVGNMFTDPAGADPVVSTLGAFNVRVVSRVSNIIDTVDTGGGGFTSGDRTKLETIHTDRYLPSDRTWLQYLYKHTKNRLRIDVATQKLILYDDDETTVLRSWTLVAKGGGALLITDGVQIDRVPD